jgi:hypothetical protein
MEAIQLENEFKNKGVNKGGLLLLKANQALTLIERCKEENLRILGIDTFIIKQGVTQPLMEYSIDFTSINEGQRDCLSAVETWKRSKFFLENKLESNFFFEIVIE